MDANKLEKLREIGYEVVPCCGNCLWPFFTHAGCEYGVCKHFTYEHLKHSEKVSMLSVHEFGYCDSHEFDDRFLERLANNQWVEFVRKV